MPPGFMQVKEVPLLESPDALVRVFAGTLQGTTSPAPHYSDLLGADVDLRSRRTCVLPLNPAYEHAVLVLSGDCTLEGQRLEERVLYTLERTGPRRASPARTVAACCSLVARPFRSRS